MIILGEDYTQSSELKLIEQEQLKNFMDEYLKNYKELHLNEKDDCVYFYMICLKK